MGGENLLKFSGVEVCGYSCHAKNKSDVTHSVIEYCLKGCGVCVSSAVSPPNKKEGHNAYAFSANEDLEYVVRGY